MIGELISDKYRIEAAISESHMYDVFAAYEVATGTNVVVKILNETMAYQPDRVKTFTDEIKSFATLSHPMIAAILDIDIFDDRPYVVTEKVEGEDLYSLINGEPLSFAESIKIIQGLGSVLQYATDLQIEHRTIKLSNILRQKDGQLKVLSFTHPRLKLAGRSERGKGSGVHSDLFFLGITLYELLVGDSPIRKRGGINELWDMKFEKFLRIRHPELNPEQLAKVVSFVKRTITRDVKLRFNSHEDFLKDLADFSSMVRVNKFRSKSQQLSMASQVVDALNGTMSNVNSSAINVRRKMNPELQLVSNQTVATANCNIGSRAVTQSQKGRAALHSNTEPAFSGNLALDTSNSTAQAIKASRPKPERPKLRLVKPSAQNTKLWDESSERHWILNPMLFMGFSLLVMILLVLFW